MKPPIKSRLIIMMPFTCIHYELVHCIYSRLLMILSLLKYTLEPIKKWQLICQVLKIRCCSSFLRNKIQGLQYYEYTNLYKSIYSLVKLINTIKYKYKIFNNFMQKIAQITKSLVLRQYFEKREIIKYQLVMKNTYFNYKRLLLQS